MPNMYRQEDAAKRGAPAVGRSEKNYEYKDNRAAAHLDYDIHLRDCSG